MKALILAAGRGSRMDDQTANQPKCFSKVSGKSLLEWQIESLTAGGIQQITVVTGYLSEMFPKSGIDKVHNPRWSSTNMVRSLLCAEALFSSGVIVSYSDIIYGKSIVEKLKDSVGDFVISYDPNWRDYWEKRFIDPLSDAESFRINRDNEIIEIGGKIMDIEEIQGQYMGLMKFSSNGISTIVEIVDSLDSKSVDMLDMTSLLQILISKGNKVVGVPISGNWCEIDSKKDLAIAEKMISEGEYKII